MKLNRSLVDKMNLFDDQPSGPFPRPSDTSPLASDIPFESSSRILLYKALAWSATVNPRSLENDWIPAWEFTVQFVLDPLSRPGRQFIAAGQRYLWYQADVEEVKKEVNMRNQHLEHEMAIEAEEKDMAAQAGAAVEQDFDEDYNALAEVSFESHFTQPATRFVNRVVTLHECIPDITVLDVSFSQLEYPDIPNDEDSDAGSEVVTKEIFVMDEGVSTQNVVERNYPGFSISALRLTGDEASHIGPWSPKKILHKLRNKYLHSGGYTIQECAPRALVELKTLPRRHLARHKFDTRTAWASFLDSLLGTHLLAMSDLATYAVILFRRYSYVQEFLAIAGAGSFWRWAIIHRLDIPWKEPDQFPRNRAIHSDEVDRFCDLFTDDYFELGTTRSDDELEKLKGVFFRPANLEFAKNRAEEAKIRFDEHTEWREAHLEGGDWYWLPRAERKAKYKQYNEELKERQNRIQKRAGRKP
ncbi:hypothetical protein F5051DRAFT_431568 [Lentinula edodes]|nr:hypothetical protein F5051DRAFT_431568 [Lentinula edodes]